MLAADSVARGEGICKPITYIVVVLLAMEGATTARIDSADKVDS